jgi:hypothetical protein
VDDDDIASSGLGDGTMEHHFVAGLGVNGHGRSSHPHLWTIGPDTGG